MSSGALRLLNSQGSSHTLMMNRIRPPCYRYCRLLRALQFEDYDRVGVDKEAGDRAWKVTSP